MSPDENAPRVSLRAALGEPLVGIAAFFAAGIAANHLLGWGLALSYGAAAISLLAWLLRERTATLWAFAFTAAGLLHFFQTGADRSAPFFDQIEKGALRVRVEGVITSAPKPTTGSTPGQRFDLRLERITKGDESYPVHRNLIIVDMRGTTPVAYGDRVALDGSLRVPRPPRNPAVFDYAGYLEHRGIFAELLADDRALEIRDHGAGNPLVALGLQGREWVSHQLTRGLEDRPPEQRALILAMTLGERDDTPAHLEDKFRFSGTLHVFAVSGLHVGIVASVAWFITTMLASLLRAPRKLAILITIAAVLAYAVVTGMRPSAVRAAVMASIFFAGMLFDREPQILNSTGAAALAILLHDTSQLFRPGFQLSFCVLIFIAAFASPLAHRLARPFQRDPFFPNSLVTPPMRAWYTFTRVTAGLVGMSIAAWAGSVLLIWYYFGLITPVSVFANLLLIPLAYIILSTAAMSVILALVPNPIPAELANDANALWTGIAAGGAGAFSELPGAHFSLPAPENFFRAPCEITSIDIPYGGGATHIAFRGGADWLIDTSGARHFGNKTHPLLSSYATGPLDGLVLTHADSDHIGGGMVAIDEYTPALVLASPYDSTSQPWRNALRAAEGADTKFHRPAAGDRFELGDGHVLHVLYPPRENAPGSVADDRCLVLRLDLADGWRILFLGDIGFYAGRWLCDNVPAENLRCDVLLRGTHDSDDSTLPGLLELAKPKAVVITDQSSRSDNPLGKEWATELRSAGVEVFQQRETGAVQMQFHQNHAELRAFLGDQSINLKRAD